VNAKSLQADELFPVNITIKQLDRVVNYQLPTVERRGEKLAYKSHKRSVNVCLQEKNNSSPTMTISMATQSTIPVVVTIQVLVTDWNSDWNKTDNEDGVDYSSQTIIRPGRSSIKYFDSNLLDTGSVIVKVTAWDVSDCLCSTISIQQPICPLYDDIDSVMRSDRNYTGQWSTMMDQGTIIVDPGQYPKGFLIVFVGSAKTDVCGASRCDDQQNMRTEHKIVKINIRYYGSDHDYTLATVISFYCISIIIIELSLSMYYYYNYY